MTNLIPGQAEVIFGKEVGDEQQIRNNIQTTLTRIIQAEQQEAPESESRLTRKHIFGNALEYELATGHRSLLIT